MDRALLLGITCRAISQVTLDHRSSFLSLSLSFYLTHKHTDTCIHKQANSLLHVNMHVYISSITHTYIYIYVCMQVHTSTKATSHNPYVYSNTRIHTSTHLLVFSRWLCAAGAVVPILSAFLKARIAACFVLNAEEMQTIFGNAGGIPFLVAILERHMESGGIVSPVCDTIAKVTFRNGLL